MFGQRRPRRLLVAALSAALLATSLALTAVPAAAQPPPPPEDVLSHFLCYKGTFADFDAVPNVILEDQFTSSTATVVAPRLLCNPVRKTRRSGEVTTIVNRRQHLKAYGIRSGALPGERAILDSNQFGVDQRLRVSEKPNRVLVPTRKAPHDAPERLDHFLCYPVREGNAIDRPVLLRDQFDSFRARVGKPISHCNPVLKIHAPNPPVAIQHRQAHLLCYAIEPHRLDPPISRRTGNQFEKGKRVRAEVAVMLCVPSTKDEVP